MASILQEPLFPTSASGIACPSTAPLSRSGSGVLPRKEWEDSLKFHGLLGTTQEGAFAVGSNQEKAAALVDKAIDGYGLPRAILQGLKDKHAHFQYYVYTRFEPLWHLNLLLLLALNFIEVPLWCHATLPHPCGDPAVFHVGVIPPLGRWQTLIIEVWCLCLLWVQTVAPILIVGWGPFFNHNIDRLRAVLCLAYSVDLVCYGLLLCSHPYFKTLPFRMAPYLRIVIIMIHIRSFRSLAAIFWGVLPRVLEMWVLVLLYLSFASWLALVLFCGKAEGAERFRGFGQTLYQMLVLLTTANNPDVWLPAYRTSRFEWMFFVAYLLVGIYFLLNLVLAVVYNSFRKQGKGFLDMEQWRSLLAEVRTYRLIPFLEDDEDNRMHLLCQISGVVIDQNRFVEWCRAVGDKSTKREERTLLQKLAPAIYSSRSFKAVEHNMLRVRDVLEKPAFGYCVWALIVLNGACVAVQTGVSLEDVHTRRFWTNVVRGLGWLYVGEVALKVGAYGFERYWMGLHNRFDFCVTASVVALEVALLFHASEDQHEEWIRYILLAQLFRLTRVGAAIKPYEVIVSTFLRLTPTLTPLLGLLVCFFALFASLGVHLFGGLIYVGHPKLEGTTFDQGGYYVCTFNDFSSAMVLLFDLLIVNNWFVWVDAYMAVTGRWEASLFFVLFFFVIVLFLTNLVTAFVLDAYFAEQDIKEEEEEASDEKSSSDGADDRHVDALYVHMLGKELRRERSSQRLTDPSASKRGSGEGHHHAGGTTHVIRL